MTHHCTVYVWRDHDGSCEAAEAMIGKWLGREGLVECRRYEHEYAEPEGEDLVLKVDVIARRRQDA